MYNLKIAPINNGLPKHVQNFVVKSKGVNPAAKKLSKVTLNAEQIEASRANMIYVKHDAPVVNKQSKKIFSDHASPEWCW